MKFAPTTSHVVDEETPLIYGACPQALTKPRVYQIFYSVRPDVYLLRYASDGSEMPSRFAWPTLLLVLTCLVALGFSVPIQQRDLQSRGVSGPVIAANFPDPGLTKVGNTWYAFATRTKGTTVHIQVASSSDFVNWKVSTNADGSPKDALPILPAWVNQTNWNTWAPSVVQISDNKFVMYFSATTSADPSARFHCIGWATATNVQGPYVGSPTSFICPLSAGGAIDPTGYQDTNGQRYVVYKVDGNSIGNGGACGNNVAPYKSTPLTLQPLGADGTTLSGSPTQLLDNAKGADIGIVEAPTITRSPQGTYFLFFSRGCFVDGSYSTNYATASKITGPYTRQSTPLIQTGQFGQTGPGGADVSKDGTHLIFHSYNGDVSAFIRSMHTATLSYSGNTVKTT